MASTSPPTFSVAQYNILGKNLASPTHFPHVKPSSLEWKERSKRIIENVKEAKINGKCADILCMEELSFYWELFKDELAKEPFCYNSVYVNRPSISVSSWSGKNKSDGCGIFYNTHMFHLVAQKSVNYHDIHDRVALIVVLKFIGQNSHVGHLIVMNTHLYWDIKKEDVQLQELKELREELEAFMENLEVEQETIPIVFAGDFNNIPSSQVYQFMQHEFKKAYKMRSSFATYGKIESAESSPFLCPDDHLSGEFEPPCTTATYKRCHTIDYIWYSSSLLEVSALLPLPTEEDLRSESGNPGWQKTVSNIIFDPTRNYNGLPNSQWGSDHIPIAAAFHLKSRDSQILQ